MLGGLRAGRGDQTSVLIHFETRKAAALLARLAFEVGRPHPRDVLAEQLWSGEDTETVRDRFRHALGALRRVLEPSGTPPGSVLRADRAEVALVAGAITTDVGEFRAALREAAAVPADNSAAQRIAFFRRAVGLYRGELLPGFYEDWIGPERERLAEEYRNALGELAHALAESGDLAGAIEHARRALALDPWREDAHADLMRFYAAAGRLPDALRQFRELERVLRDEFGLAPSGATRALLARLQAAASAPPPSGEPSRSPAMILTTVLEAEGGAVPLDSPFYIVRPADHEFGAAVGRRDSIVLVKGARQMGKTSLLARGVQQAREAGARWC
jgi:DNA-binding SARP family transcriptional activator